MQQTSDRNGSWMRRAAGCGWDFLSPDGRFVARLAKSIAISEVDMTRGAGTATHAGLDPQELR